MVIVTDIGGTYIRFAQSVEGVPIRIHKYKTSQFETAYTAFNQYCEDENIEAQQGDILLAAAGVQKDGVCIVVNNPDWKIDCAQFEAHGWHVRVMMNDFEAGSYALPVLKTEDLKTLRVGNKKLGASFSLLGVGTGLGLSYFHHPNKVQKTHGGHMPVVCVTDEQWDVVKSFKAQKGAPVIFEDLLSGQNDFVKTHRKLFHEFLGLFAVQSVIHGHAYGGVYLTGGIVEALVAEDKFDFESFEKHFCFGAVPAVQEDLKNTPIHIVTDPYPALKGLIYAQSILDN